MALVATLIAFLVMARRVVREAQAVRTALVSSTELRPVLVDLAADARGLTESARALRRPPA